MFSLVGRVVGAAEDRDEERVGSMEYIGRISKDEVVLLGRDSIVLELLCRTVQREESSKITLSGRVIMLITNATIC